MFGNITSFFVFFVFLTKCRCRSLADPTMEGRIPQNAVYLNHHSFNVYLDVLKVLVKHPIKLQECLKFFPTQTIIELLCAKNLLGEALSSLSRLEWLENQRRKLETVMLLLLFCLLN